MLKKIRVILAVLFFTCITLLFLDFTGTLHCWFGWMAKIQLIPALLTNVASISLIIMIFTQLFGRIYCSVVCPLGVFQDAISRLSRKRKKSGFRYSKNLKWLRYGISAAFIIAVIMSTISIVVSLLDPYAVYGRMVSNLLSPLYIWGNNLLAWFAERQGSYAFYPKDVWIKSGITFGVSVATFIIIGFLAWRKGRFYCNTICPVGTILGIFARKATFRVAFDEEKCTQCKLCERNCKSSCINAKEMYIDYTRCVNCFNCIESCKFDAIKYLPLKAKEKELVEKEKELVEKEIDALNSMGYANDKSTQTEDTADKSAQDNSEGVSRRKVLSIMALIAAGSVVKAQHAATDGGLAVIENKKIPNRKTPITPPGSEGSAHLKQNCTACQMCISVCPNDVLRPSNRLALFMQPEMSYERGYCRPECTKCSQVCPSHAIKPITTAEKSAISIGCAVWLKDNCVINTDNVQCTNCERHCPTGAIMLVDSAENNSLKIPVIDKERCIGCGACENLCPARPFSAIYVEGNLYHHTI